MNLVDYRKTSPAEVFDEIARRAEAAGVPVAGSEVVGLIPGGRVRRRASRNACACSTSTPNEQIVERRLANAPSA